MIRVPFAILLLLQLGCRMTQPTPGSLPDFDARWNYNQPAETAARFEQILRDTRDTAPPEYIAELLTQIARTHSLRRNFDQAHAVLDQVQAMLARPNMQTATIRHRLERGRTFNSAGDKPAATRDFQDAWKRAGEAGRDGLAVDAAHMLAIVSPPAEALAWNERAFALAEASDDPAARKWRGSLANNIGWTHFEQRDYDRALDSFERALVFREESGTAAEIQIARWCIAKTCRMQGRLDDALKILRELEASPLEDAEPGYTWEELAECLLAQGSAEAARPYFARAHERLSQDPWLVENEPDRIARLRQLGDRPAP